MAVFNPFARPRLRPVEARPLRTDDGQITIHVHDPAQHAAGTLSVSPGAYFLMTHMDGEHTLEQIEAVFAAQFGHPLGADQLSKVVEQLSRARFLDDHVFADYYRGLVDDYRRSPTRRMGDGPVFGETGAADLAQRLEEMLAGGTVHHSARPLTGLIVPHLDFARGAPCYADGYRTLAAHNVARRFVVLGTNHFGQASAVTSTEKDFTTPLGTLPNDRDFLERLQSRLGTDLRHHEVDHAREHSIELQVLVLQQVFGGNGVCFVPFLCPSPCGPTGTLPYDGQGVDLRTFAETLRQCLDEDGTPTCLIAGADLSHVGRFFGDDRDLGQAFLEQVAREDRKFLAAVLTGDAEGMVTRTTECGNPTRLCSVGCIHALLVALPEATAELLRYHQAVVSDWQNCVTCAAVSFC